MLVACRLAGLSALEAYHAGVRARAQFGPRGQLSRLVQMAAKSRKLAGNSKLGDDDAITSLGNSHRRLCETGDARRAPDDGRQQPKETKPK